MTDMVYTVEPRRLMRINKIKLEPGQEVEFLEIVERAYKAKKPKPEDLKAIRKFLIAHPEFCRAIFSITDLTQRKLIETLVSDEIAKTALEEHVNYLRDEFGYHEAPIMEKMLIDNIVNTWLRVQYIDFVVTAKMGGEFYLKPMEFWQRSLLMAQKNYLAACESLAKIRKMKLPNIQLNIGDKQINVAGDLKPGTTEIINV